MSHKEEPRRFRPFIPAANRHDIIVRLGRQRADLIQNTINDLIRSQIELGSAGKSTSVPGKFDGKNGALDGAAAWVDWGSPSEVPWGAPQPPPKVPKGKDTKEGKEQKDGKESKEGKEAKDGKEGKDTSDGAGKFGGDEVSNPFTLYGEIDELNWGEMNNIALTQGDRINGLIQGSAGAIF